MILYCATDLLFFSIGCAIFTKLYIMSIVAAGNYCFNKLITVSAL